jgi:hypothetical protein
VTIKKQKRVKPPSRTPETPNEHDLLRAQITSGVASGKRLNKKLKDAFGVPYSFLTELQWEEIRSKAGFRHSARFEINIALRRYWLERLDKTISDETRKAVTETTKKLRDAFEALFDLISNDEFFRGPVVYHQVSPLRQRQELEETCDSISHAQVILSAAAKRLARGPGQPSFGPLYDLIHHLDFILHAQHNIRLTRSNNRIPVGGATDTPIEYVWTVIKLAHLQVSKSTVDTVLKDYITERDEHDRHFPERQI